MISIITNLAVKPHQRWWVP